MWYCPCRSSEARNKTNAYETKKNIRGKNQITKHRNGVKQKEWKCVVACERVNESDKTRVQKHTHRGIE